MLSRAATWLDPDIYDNPDRIDAEAEYYADESQWYVKRTKSYGFASKGGFNNEHHNHNDVGSFIFSKDGRQLITDMGRGAYTKQYFKPETRYDFIECSSLGHSVPYFNDEIPQKFGNEYAAKDYVFSPGYYAMDIAGAYGDERIKSVKREFRTYDEYVTVTDTFDSDAAITERLVSIIEPEISEGKVKILCAEIEFDNSLCDVSVKETVTSKRFTAYLIDFKLRDGVNRFEFKIK